MSVDSPPPLPTSPPAIVRPVRIERHRASFPILRAARRAGMIDHENKIGDLAGLMFETLKQRCPSATDATRKVLRVFLEHMNQEDNRVFICTVTIAKLSPGRAQDNGVAESTVDSVKALLRSEKYIRKLYGAELREGNSAFNARARGQVQKSDHVTDTYDLSPLFDLLPTWVQHRLVQAWKEVQKSDAEDERRQAIAAQQVPPHLKKTLRLPFVYSPETHSVVSPSSRVDLSSASSAVAANGSGTDNAHPLKSIKTPDKIPPSPPPSSGPPGTSDFPVSGVFIGIGDEKQEQPPVPSTKPTEPEPKNESEAPGRKAPSPKNRRENRCLPQGSGGSDPVAPEADSEVVRTGPLLERFEALSAAEQSAVRALEWQKMRPIRAKGGRGMVDVPVEIVTTTSAGWAFVLIEEVLARRRASESKGPGWMNRTWRNWLMDDGGWDDLFRQELLRPNRASAIPLEFQPENFAGLIREGLALKASVIAAAYKLGKRPALPDGVAGMVGPTPAAVPTTATSVRSEDIPSAGRSKGAAAASPKAAKPEDGPQRACFNPLTLSEEEGAALLATAQQIVLKYKMYASLSPDQQERRVITPGWANGMVRSEAAKIWQERQEMPGTADGKGDGGSE